MKKLVLFLALFPVLSFAQEQEKDPKLEKLLQQVTKAYQRTKTPGYFIPEFSVSTRMEGISFFNPKGNSTLGGAQTMIDVKFWRYMSFGALRFTMSTPFTRGGSHTNPMINYAQNKNIRLGLWGGGGGTVLDQRPGGTGRGSALTLAIFGGGEFLEGNYSCGGLEFSLRYQYNFHRYFALTTGFDIGWRIYTHKDTNISSANSLVYGWTFGLAF